MKFIFFFIFFFLVIRTVVRVLRRGFFVINRGGPNHGQPSGESFSSARNVEEADYEVLESQINNKKQEVI